jgi:hypothetical protein
MAFYFWTFAIGQNLHRNGRFPTHSFPSTPFPTERGENSNGRFSTPSSERGGTSIYYSRRTILKKCGLSSLLISVIVFNLIEREY